MWARRRCTPARSGRSTGRFITRAHQAGALPDLTDYDLARLLKGISAHSTRVGLNQDLFTSGEDLAGIMMRCAGRAHECRSPTTATSPPSRAPPGG
jgi:hypothetical protein